MLYLSWAPWELQGPEQSSAAPSCSGGGPWGLSRLPSELNQGWMQHVGVAAPGRADGEACRDEDENAPGLRRAQIDGAKSLQLSLLFVYGKL